MNISKDKGRDLMKLVCTGERDAIIAIREVAEKYDDNLRLKTIYGKDCFMFENRLSALIDGKKNA